MISRILSVLLLLVIAVPLVTFLVINRNPVSLSLDPFGTMPQFVFDLPLSLIIIASALVGVVVGCVFTWISEGTNRREAWRRKFEMEKMEREKAELEDALQRLRQERAERANAERGLAESRAIAPAPGGSPKMIGSERAA
ncbi:LapA family protein [Fulvimarina endophytica]|uniref:LapA family protein n=1 Tax=Fulvimarina endophytica TaxID=2293836 RepID=A0A371X1J6_9HYPH|nr:LapA family protein [Fulvimarina endophytica]RFC63110.1 LapA family protein [Fulvimarina endophytica]